MRIETDHSELVFKSSEASLLPECTLEARMRDAAHKVDRRGCVKPSPSYAASILSKDRWSKTNASDSDITDSADEAVAVPVPVLPVYVMPVPESFRKGAALLVSSADKIEMKSAVTNTGDKPFSDADKPEDDSKPVSTLPNRAADFLPVTVSVARAWCSPIDQRPVSIGQKSPFAATGISLRETQLSIVRQAEVAVAGPGVETTLHGRSSAVPLDKPRGTTKALAIAEFEQKLARTGPVTLLEETKVFLSARSALSLQRPAADETPASLDRPQASSTIGAAASLMPLVSDVSPISDKWSGSLESASQVGMLDAPNSNPPDSPDPRLSRLGFNDIESDVPDPRLSRPGIDGVKSGLPDPSLSRPGFDSIDSGLKMDASSFSQGEGHVSDVPATLRAVAVPNAANLAVMIAPAAAALLSTSEARAESRRAALERNKVRNGSTLAPRGVKGVTATQGPTVAPYVTLIQAADAADDVVDGSVGDLDAVDENVPADEKNDDYDKTIHYRFKSWDTVSEVALQLEQTPQGATQVRMQPSTQRVHRAMQKAWPQLNPSHWILEQQPGGAVGEVEDDVRMSAAQADNDECSKRF